jgi:hypothetical protein
MEIDVQEQDGSIVIIVDDEEIEFTEADLESIGITAKIATELLKDEDLETH